jgi:L-cysteine:1D-myo-inositol 2-amino-2-deoxy-alpha-D-glucopyranoside ligase
MSAAHAESLTGAKPFAQTYMHAGMVSLDGEKMSKSLGNLVFVSKLRQQGIDPMAIRLVLLSHHYRSDWEWLDAELEVAKDRLRTWRAAFSQKLGAVSPIAQIVSVMSRDLDTPNALKVVDDWARETLAGACSVPTQDVAEAVDAIFGII